MKENIRSIQFMRFVAAALVAASHILQGLPGYYDNATSASVDYLAGFGGAGVHIFFVISGFVMVFTSFAGADHTFEPPKFFIRRFIRIYPIYWIYAIAYLLFFTTFVVGYVAPSPGRIIAAFLLLPGSSSAIIGPGWTLAFEMYFYICFGGAMILGLRRGLPLLTAFFVVLITLHAALKISPETPYPYVFTNSLLAEFLFGAWIAYFVVHKKSVSERMATAMAVSGLLLFAGGCIVGYHRLPSVIMWGIPSGLLIAGLVFLERNGRLSDTVRRYAWLGDSSYSLYLLHVLVIDVMLTIAVHLYPTATSSFDIATIFAIVLGTSIALSVAAYTFLERPLVLILQKLASLRLPGLMGARQKTV